MVAMATQGIWPAESDGTDINSVDRSHTYGAVPVIACGDDFGAVRLLNYPCTAKGAPAKVTHRLVLCNLS